MRSGRLIFAIMLLPGLVLATTIHVAQDGSGDFTTIQEAVDAASAGDVIHIHAGRYLQITEGWDYNGDGMSSGTVHVGITQDHLTLRGDGPDVTIIGPESTPGGMIQEYFGVVVAPGAASSLVIEDLAVESTNWGIYAGSSRLEVRNGRFVGHVRDAIHLRGVDQMATIADCRFLDCSIGLFVTEQSANVEVSRCQFWVEFTGIQFYETTGALVSDCQFVGGSEGVEFRQNSVGAVVRSTAIGPEWAGFTTVSGGVATITDCEVDGGQTGLKFFGGAGATVTGCTLRNQTLSAVYVHAEGPHLITGCTILNGGSWSARCVESGDCLLDMRGNDWGTDSEEQIAAWIHDSVDQPSLSCTVAFVPFVIPVATEERNWGDIKRMFR